MSREDYYGIGRAAEALAFAACVCCCMFLLYKCASESARQPQTIEGSVTSE